ncbi:CFA_G0057130.mRNA.1.CDS.1 [Saccharomyces cerevisiae]|nr:CFA_G0057130.mRNA.1.CDS.1 [Saccharomyces cerevisiae]CAI7488594.1 CFA_G0057130.mRNA.1.CDS.1 [Saccharomyces cerevisiae]
MMPAKLHLDVLRTLAVPALGHGTQTLKNSNFLERFPQRPYRLLPPILPGTFSRPSSKSTAPPLSSIHPSCSILYNTTL